MKKSMSLPEDWAIESISGFAMIKLGFEMSDKTPK
jgi:hypothetical protein